METPAKLIFKCKQRVTTRSDFTNHIIALSVLLIGFSAHLRRTYERVLEKTVAFQNNTIIWCRIIEQGLHKSTFVEMTFHQCPCGPHVVSLPICTYVFFLWKVYFLGFESVDCSLLVSTMSFTEPGLNENKALKLIITLTARPFWFHVSKFAHPRGKFERVKNNFSMFFRKCETTGDYGDFRSYIFVDLVLFRQCIFMVVIASFAHSRLRFGTRPAGR